MSKSVKMMLLSVTISLNAMVVSYICSWESTPLSPVLLVLASAWMSFGASRELEKEDSDES